MIMLQLHALPRAVYFLADDEDHFFSKTALAALAVAKRNVNHVSVDDGLLR